MLPPKREVADSQESAVADRLGLENRQCGSSQAEWEEERPSHKQEQPQQTLGTHENKGQASHSHAMCGGLQVWGTEPRECPQQARHSMRIMTRPLWEARVGEGIADS